MFKADVLSHPARIDDALGIEPVRVKIPGTFIVPVAQRDQWVFFIQQNAVKGPISQKIEVAANGHSFEIGFYWPINQVVNGKTVMPDE